jgi:hypothetical protein
VHFLGSTGWESLPHLGHFHKLGYVTNESKMCRIPLVWFSGNIVLGVVSLRVI